MGLVSINGKIAPSNQATISVFDRGFLFNDSVFETLVGFNGKVLNLEDHMNRLHRSAESLEIPIPWSNEMIHFELQTMLEQLKYPKSMTRLVVTRGEGLGLATSPQMQPNRVLIAEPAKIEAAAVYAQGLSLRRKVLPYTIRGPAPKTSQYSHSILALKKARAEGFDDVVWSNSEGEFTEATTANIFFIGRQGDLVEIATPPATSGILLGITRHTLMDLATTAKIKITERTVYADELAMFDEAFVCSTVRGLVPVNRIDQHKLHTARAGSVFRHLERLYLTWVETQIGYRVDWNTGTPISR